MAKIITPTCRIFEFYNEHQGIMEEEDVMYRVAESDAGDLRLYIATEYGTPVFYVYQKTSEAENELDDEDDKDTGLFGFKCIQTEYVVPIRGRSIKDETEEVMSNLIEDFIDYVDLDEEEEEQKENIKEREEELSDAASEFLAVALYRADTVDYVDAEEFLDDVMRLLYEKYGVSPYRPMILEDEQGEFYKDHPYPSLIYKMSDQVTGE